MPLLNLFNSNPEDILRLNIEQIVSNAGNGKLGDAGEAQTELREFLREVDVEILAAYADQCLTQSFNKSGFVLQDIVNEFGRRLEYEVINGRYQGIRKEVGFDGIWKDCSGSSIVVEVKTTDAYRISLDNLIKYKSELESSEKINENSSILIVVGREDSGELEAQVRGSRHAWDIRVISVESIVKLIRIKEIAGSENTLENIHHLLTPLEYTRLDKLVDVMFATTQDTEESVSTEVETSMDITEEGDDTRLDKIHECTSLETIKGLRKAIVRSFRKKHGIHLLKKTEAVFWDSDCNFRAVCAVSKPYSKGSSRYWYAYHAKWHEFLAGAKKGFFILGCVDLNIAFELPFKLMVEQYEKLDKTINKKNSSKNFCHIKIWEADKGQYELYLPKFGNVSLEPYKIEVDRGKQ